MINKKLIAIIPGAGKPKNPLFPNVYDLMIPLNGKPTINYILEELENKEIDQVIIILDKKDLRTRKYLEFMNFNIKITLLDIENSLSLLESIKLACSEIKDDNHSILINLGDTIYFGEHNKKIDYLITSKENLYNSKNWCYVENKNETQLFHDKPDEYIGGEVITGIYYFKEGSYFQELIENSNEDESFASIISKYSSKYLFELIDENSKWLDTGNLNHYQDSKIFFLRKRHFNSFNYDPFKGIITKKSKNNSKILWEINWYNNIPKEVRIFSPRLIDYTISDDSSEYSIEFYGYPSLTELYIYGKLSNEYWKIIMKKIIRYLSFVKNNFSTSMDKESMKKMYINKTLERIEKIDFIPNIKDVKTYMINGKKYTNPFNSLNEKKLNELMESLSKDENFTILHGDLCFNNILFDINTGIFKTIDPRGNFGKTSIYGDIKYDIAKLRHSINGMYDYITTDLFKIEKELITESEYVINYSFFNSKKYDGLKKWFDKQISKEYDLNLIKIVEGLLFITMIPLHSDNTNRQKIMLAKGIELCSEYFNKEKNI
ncbi:hypothetical protein C0585_07585 [Candidatus Woesearchaeota archaeon]|nr:MAG: hypothetical protein C0585_07585 [Candidatus Woesearchaeota archaeon]